ncbi:MAG TPA: pilus assembly protein [Bauldia sp.]|nr:pilus assembly protein [Bauldia sp.]
MVRPMLRAARRLLARSRPIRARFGRDRSGVSAVEFAIILPIMVLLFFGSVELTDALTVKRKVTHVASTLSDLVAQSKTLSAGEIDDILAAAAAIITPYSDSKLKIKLTGVTVDSKKKATVSWSRTKNDTAYAKGASFTLPTDILEASTFIVVGEVKFNYAPLVGYVLTGSFDLNDKFYLRPRLGKDVQFTG